ncbi:MAG: DUF1015 domain-containing protein [Candidatus Tantalella remota]|nr:DUF1015 domain-containing protein [Candidatus Tantalella remota]
MAEVRPFKGLLYDKNKVDDYASVVAPPYDVISDAERDALYGASDYNIIRLTLGKASEGDNDSDNKYIRARKALDQWQQQGVLSADENESYYVYAQEYEYKGKKHSRIGFLGLMKIVDPGKDTILPHEYTLSKPKEDRMNLIKQVEGNLSPIFTLFADESGEVKAELDKCAAAGDPLVDVELAGVRHKLWKLSDGVSAGKISSAMASEKIFIADGHHRYEVARTYRNARREENGYSGSADHILMYFTGMEEDNDLTVMATHRAIKVMPEGDAEATLGKYFDISDCGDLDMLVEKLEGDGSTENVFGFLSGGKYLLLTPKAEADITALITEDKTGDWKRLDVSVLHAAVLDVILSGGNKEGNITYLKNPEDAEALVLDGSHQAAFLLNPTRVDQLKAVAEHCEMMPQKSTYFYPKLLTGLVVNRFETSDSKSEEKEVCS